MRKDETVPTRGMWLAQTSPVYMLSPSAFEDPWAGKELASSRALLQVQREALGEIKCKSRGEELVRGEGKDSKEEMELKNAEVFKDILDVTGKGDSPGKM